MSAELPYVPAMTPPAPVTADELLHTHVSDKRVELVRGVVVVREPPGFRHGSMTMALGTQLSEYVTAKALGRVFTSEIGFRLASDPDTVRAPDVAFITRERLPEPGLVGYPALAPDLVVEVLSPHDRPGETLGKVGDWLEGGARLVWVVNAERRVARVYRADGSEVSVSADESLDGEDVVPGFSCLLSSILP